MKIYRCLKLFSSALINYVVRALEPFPSDEQVEIRRYSREGYFRIDFNKMSVDGSEDGSVSFCSEVLFIYLFLFSCSIRN